MLAIVASGIDDVRDVLDFYRGEEDVVAAFKRNQEALRRQQEEQLMQMQQKASGRWSFFGRVGNFIVCRTLTAISAVRDWLTE